MIANPLKIHKDWTKAIMFEFCYPKEVEEFGCAAKVVAYGWSAWPSRSEWIIPGTIEF